MTKILCIIPARSGSKGIPHKNIRNFNGLPLLAWSIKQAQRSKYSKLMRIIVSTDYSMYIEIAKRYGAEAPFLRPKEISGDLSTDIECVKHCLEWLKVNDNYEPDIILQLRPTQPCRKVSDIDKCLDLFIKNIDSYDSLRTVVPFEKSAFKMYTVDIRSTPKLNPLFKTIYGINEPYNKCRQSLPQCYLHNGYIDIFKASLVAKNTLSGDSIYPYIMNPEDTLDIDTVNDWKKAEKKFSWD